MTLSEQTIKDLILSQTANGFEMSNGIDSLEECRDPIRFKTYHKTVLYQYNYMGYRDEDWPDDIMHQIWCIGDSFTVGLGQPADETWSNILSGMIQERIINISMNGASNDWIARRAVYILEHFKPKAVLIKWSYLHRREDANENLLDEERAIWYFSEDTEDVKNFVKNLKLVESSKDTVSVIHSFIPKFFKEDSTDDKEVFAAMKELNAVVFPPCEQIDFSRDGHHYDILTATKYAECYFEKLNQLRLTNE